jgi:hypothetical protein
MAAISIAFRRTLLLLTIAVAVSATATWWRRRSATPLPAAPPVWPALASDADGAVATRVARAATDAAWVPPGADGSAPASHPIKAKETSGIYHVPGGRFYDRTKPDRCYATASAAEADGYRQSKT